MLINMHALAAHFRVHVSANNNNKKVLGRTGAMPEADYAGDGVVLL